MSELPEIQKLVTNAEQALAGSGRVLLRYSGTEPKVRLLIEGRDSDQINTFADEIAAALKTAIGV
jgi:phosphoglucosamine mutase